MHLRLPGNGFGSITPIQYEQINGWLDDNEIDDSIERRYYRYFIFQLDDAYRYYQDKKGNIERKQREKKKITEEDLKLDIDTDFESIEVEFTRVYDDDEE